MDAAEVLALYDDQMRANPAPEIGVRREWIDGVLRTIGAFNFIGWWDFPVDRADEIAAREANFFHGLGGETEWKVYGHDRPPGLERALARAGFKDDGPETLVVMDLEASDITDAPPPGVEVRRVTDLSGIHDLMEANALAFGKDAPWQLQALPPRLADPTLGLYVAYADGKPVCSGRLEMAESRPFAGLYGGGTAPEHRGRGVYRALVAARAAEARRKGVRYLTSDARETSRPILERLGFQSLTTIRGWALDQG